MQATPIYHERLISNKTTALFLVLTILCACTFVWRLLVVSMDWLAILLLALACFFLFYTVNYRTLDIQINIDSLRLKFGIFSWRIPLKNIAQVELDDDIPWLMLNGGAGIHFMFVNGRYRASYNFLEHARVVIKFKKKVGPISYLSFSTRQPAQIFKYLEDAFNRSGPVKLKTY